MARRRRKKTLNPVLRLAYGNRAMKLKDAILSLVSPPPSAPHRDVTQCSICRFADVTAHPSCTCDVTVRPSCTCDVIVRPSCTCDVIIRSSCTCDVIVRPSDPLSYRQLIGRAVCALPAVPPQFPVVDLARQLSQRQIVTNTIKWMLQSCRSNDNLLSKSYDMISRTSLSGEILCSSDWCLLLERVGDSVMEFILRHYSIFVPSSKTSGKAFIQVTGTPLTKSLRNVKASHASSLGSTAQKKATRGENAKSTNSQSCAHNGGNKRKRDEIAKSTNSQSCAHNEGNKTKRDENAKRTNSQSCAHNGGNKTKRDEIAKSTDSQSCAHNEGNKRKRDENAKSTNSQSCAHNEGNKTKRDEFANNNEGNMNCSVEKKRNRQRLYSWQRRKQLKMGSQITKGNLGFSSGFFENSIKNNTIGSNLMPESQHAKDKCACFYCFMLRSTRKVPIHSQIQRRYIFYNKYSSQLLFRKNHILSRLKPNDCGALSLMKSIFGNHDSYSNFIQCTSCGDSASSRSNCLYHSFIALFKSLIRNAQRCRHRRLLRKHCSVQNESLLSTNGQQNVNKENYSSESFSKHQQVVAFIFATLRNIIPQSLMGNKESWRALRKNIWSCVKLRRYENFTVQDCLKGLRVSQFEFLLKLESSSCSCEASGSRKTEKNLPASKKHILTKNLLNTWIYWLFSLVILPVVRSCFYVTERENKRYDVFYYKKPVWMNIVKETISSLKEKTLNVLDRPSLREVFAIRKKLLAERSFGFSKVRFLPKEDTLRPLANLSKPSKLGFNSIKLKKKALFSYQPVNSSLHELNIVLKKISVENPNLFGSSVFDYNDAYQKLYNFTLEVKIFNKFMPKVFIVVADVKRAFDSIDHDMLLRIMKDIIGNERYSVGKYTQIISRKNRLTPIYRRSFGCINSNFSVQLSSNSGVFVDQASYLNIKKQLFYSLLFQHVKHNILQIGGQFYEQKVGIAQGSILSSLLCSFYFGHLEETLIWPFLKKLEEKEKEVAPHSLLMRYLDDFIFVSTSQKQAMGFFERVKRGFGDYNCFMNDAKYGWCNFDINKGGFINRRYIGKDGVPFLPWSGLLVNCNTLEIQADYTRYWGINMRSTLTVNKSDKPHMLLRKKLCGYMLPKCHVILYDSNINSPPTVRLNLYQAFLVCAMKFHCYICEMSDPISSLETLTIIQKTFSYMYNLLHKRMKEMETNFGLHPVLKLRKNETVWLGISAYIRILKRKQSRYTELLYLLRENLANCNISVRPSNDLLYATDDSHSSMFWKIKF